MIPHTWSARVRAADSGALAVLVGTGSFLVGPQLTFQDDPSPGVARDSQDLRDPPAPPTALQYVLGAFAADVLGGFRAAAERRRVQLDDVEFAVSCRLNNPLVFLGVVGEAGHAGIEEITGTLYASADLDRQVLDELWSETLARSPLVSTFRSAVKLSLQLKVV